MTKQAKLFSLWSGEITQGQAAGYLGISQSDIRRIVTALESGDDDSAYVRALEQILREKSEMPGLELPLSFQLPVRILEIGGVGPESSTFYAFKRADGRFRLAKANAPLQSSAVMKGDLETVRARIEPLEADIRENPNNPMVGPIDPDIAISWARQDQI